MLTVDSVKSFTVGIPISRTGLTAGFEGAQLESRIRYSAVTDHLHLTFFIPLFKQTIAREPPPNESNLSALFRGDARRCKSSSGSRLDPMKDCITIPVLDFRSL